MEKSKPIFFEHKQVCSLFIYNAIEEVYDFLRLICTQLRCKLNPSCLSIYLYDETTLGSDCLYFVSKDENLMRSGTADRMFLILTDEASLNAKMEELATELLKRSSSVKRNYANVAEYNKDMLALESLTLSYIFLFIVNPQGKIFGDATMKRVLRNGGAVGIFPHIFISKSEVFEMGDSAKNMLDLVSQVYLLQNGVIFERAKDFVLDSLVKKT